MLIAQNRYTSRVFEQITIEKDIVYAVEDSWDFTGFGMNDPESLSFDIYYPANDKQAKRPLVVCLYGGAFLQGSKERRDMKAWCDSLAHYGYVAAAINYRMGFNPLGSGKAIGSDAGIIRAMYRATQDCRAAVRYLIHTSDRFGIDTTQIFLLGNSAGAITSINTVYMDDSERPPETYSTGFGANNADLRCLDCTGSFSDHRVKISGVVAFWGATSDLSLLDDYDAVPMLFIHGSLDPIVPFDKDYALNFTYGKDLNVYFYGSKAMKEHFDSLGCNAQFYPYEGQGHCFYSCGSINISELDYSIFPSDYWWPLFYQTIRFLGENNKYCNKKYLPALETNVDFTIIETKDRGNFELQFEGNLLMNNRLTVYNAIGDVVSTQILQTPKTLITLAGKPAGVYIAEVRNHAHKLRLKMMVK